MSKAPSSERAGVRQTIRALVADGWTLHSVDGERVNGEHEAMEQIEATGFARLYVRRALESGWVFFTIQNGAPDEVVCDYTTNLTALDTLTEGWY